MSQLDDYRAIREGAALGAIAPRLQIAVAGTDRAAYLQGLLTNDIVSLTPGSGCYSAWLSPQGRMLTDMHVLESGGLMLLDVPEHTLQATLQRLEQFIFSEDVRVESLAASVAPVWVHGPQAEGVLGRVLPAAQGLGEWPEYHHAQLTLGGLPVSVARISQLGVPGFCVFVERARASECVAAIAAEGAVVVSPEALAAARIEAGYPVFGVDMTDDTIPLEAGIEQRAISFTKGCYVGQEVVIRILHRGHGRVVRKLAPLRIEGAPPAHGAKIHAGDREIGFITSAAASPRSGTIALGYVHRDFLAPGTSVEVEAGAARAHAVVTDQAGLMAV